MSIGPGRLVIVTRPTRLEGLVAKHGTWAQARFLLERAGQGPARYEAEHAQYHEALAQVRQAAAKLSPRQAVVARSQVSGFLFSEDDVVACVGQDGLVANVAKYTGAAPIVGVNPDPQGNLGLLVPFAPAEAGALMEAALLGRARCLEVALVEACLQDGQRLLGFNEIFIGPRGHGSLRYRLSLGQAQEEQSSSGLIVATGAGSTGWWSSLMAMARGVSEAWGGQGPSQGASWAWEERRLGWAVREPYPGRALGVSLVAGRLGPDEALRLESQVEAGGVIFSDGLEADALAFDAGAIATVGLAKEVARLVAA